MVGGPVIGTGTFGMSCSVVCLARCRSLMPIIASHTVIVFVIGPRLFMTAIAMTHGH